MITSISIITAATATANSRLAAKTRSYWQLSCCLRSRPDSNDYTVHQGIQMATGILKMLSPRRPLAKRTEVLLQAIIDKPNKTTKPTKTSQHK